MFYNIPDILVDATFGVDGCFVRLVASLVLVVVVVFVVSDDKDKSI
jgi:hypothetical protein